MKGIILIIGQKKPDFKSSKRQKPKASPRRDEAATKDKTFAPRSHGVTEKNKIDGFVPDRWSFAVSKT